MQLLLLLVAGVGLTYFGIACRRCDLFTLAFVSTCVYFLPGFFGTVLDGAGAGVRVPVEPQTYAVMLAVLAAILAGAWCCDPQFAGPMVERTVASDPTATHVAALLAVAGLVCAMYTGGAGLFSASKVDVMAVTSRWFLLLAFGASLSLALAFLHRQWTLFALSGVMLLFTVFVGFRSACAMAAIAVFLVHFHRQGPQRLAVRNRTSLALIGVVSLFFFAYKLVYKLIKLGEFDLVAESLSDPEFYLEAVVASEPFGTQMVLNEVLRTGFQTDAAYILESVAAQFTLFSGELGVEFVSFNELFQPKLFADADFGMAANIWAQMLAAGGWPLFLLFLAGYVASLRIGSLWLDSGRLTTRAAVAVGAAYWAFYIHRNDLGYELSLLKRVLLVWLAVVLVSEAAHRLGRQAAPRRLHDRSIRRAYVPHGTTP